MAINYISHSKYSIDWNAFRNELSSYSILRSSELQQEYIDSWLEKLKRIESISDEQFDSYFNIHDICPEVLQFELDYNSNTFILHFPVTPLEKQIQNLATPDMASEWSLEDFTQPSSIVKWTKPEDKLPFNSAPIILIPLISGKYYNRIVVDGNHRVDYAVRHNFKSIKAYDVDAETMRICFLNRTVWGEDTTPIFALDCLLYSFHYELNRLAEYTTVEGHTDEEALSHIFFKTGCLGI